MIDFSTYPPLVTADALGLTDADDDMVAAACEAIRGYCHWHIAPTAVDDVIVVDNGFGRHVLALPTKHLTAVAEVVDRDSNPITDFEWSPSGLLERAQPWPTGLNAVTVTATHGLPEAPSGIVSVLLDMVSDQKASADGPSISNAQLDGARIDWATPSSDVGVRRRIAYAYGHILNRYRI